MCEELSTAARRRAFALMWQMRAKDPGALMSVLTETLASRETITATLISLMELAEKALLDHCPNPDTWLEAGMAQAAS